MSAVALGTDLSMATATELVHGYATGDVSPVEVVDALLDRIAAVEPALNAIITLRAEEARTAAAASAQRWHDGAALPLDGVPYGLKDIIATAGIRTTGGSELYTDLVPTETAAHAARLEAAGGILLAKLGTFEFACGGAQNQAFGEVHNPWDLSRTTGGSSSGSGAAVSAGMVPLAIGTDTGGSIRIPAAYCGITGLKPTYGRVPRHGVMGLSWTLDHAGPMTRSAADAALMLGVIAGHDSRDSYSSKRPVPDYVALLQQDFSGTRIGRPGGWLEEPMHPAVAAVYERAVAELASLGAEIVDVDLGGIETATAAAWQVCFAEMLSLHTSHFPTLEHRDSMGAGMLAAAPFVSSQDYLRALRYRPVFMAQMSAALEGCVALVMPAATTAPPRLDTMTVETGQDGDDVDWLFVATRNHIPFNYTGVPGLCVPCGLADGTPVGLQLIGRPHDDATLLALGHAYQDATAYHRIVPPLTSSASTIGR